MFLYKSIQDDTIINGEIMKGIANSTALSDITLISSAIDNITFDTSISNSRFMDSHTENITQTLDVSSKLIQSHTQSESTIYRKVNA